MSVHRPSSYKVDVCALHAIKMLIALRRYIPDHSWCQIICIHVWIYHNGAQSLYWTTGTWPLTSSVGQVNSRVTRAETRDICSGGKTETSSSEFKTSPYETETFQAENETKTEKQKKILRPSWGRDQVSRPTTLRLTLTRPVTCGLV